MRSELRGVGEVGQNVTIVLIGCVSVTVTRGIGSKTEKYEDVIFEWLLVLAAPRRRLVIHPNDRLNTTNAGLTDHKSGKGWKNLLSDKAATCKLIAVCCI